AVPAADGGVDHHRLPDPQCGVRPGRLDAGGTLVPENGRVGRDGVASAQVGDVAAADPGGIEGDQHLAGRGGRDVNVVDAEAVRSVYDDGRVGHTGVLRSV